MARPNANSTRPLLIVVAATIILAVLPSRWLQPWTAEVADVVKIPLVPPGDLLNKLRLRLRPPARIESSDSPEVAALEADRDHFRALWHSERLRADELQSQLQELTLTVQLGRGGDIRPLAVDIAGRSPESRRGMLRLNQGSAAGVRPGTVAVFQGAHLIGRVAADVSALSSWLIPTIDPQSGRLDSVLLPKDREDLPIEQAVRVQLTPAGDGTLTGDVDREADAAPGDVLILDDPSWRSAARGMIIGYVESVNQRDDQPLRRRLIVRPRFNAHELATIVLKIEQEDAP